MGQETVHDVGMPDGWEQGGNWANFHWGKMYQAIPYSSLLQLHHNVTAILESKTVDETDLNEAYELYQDRYHYRIPTVDMALGEYLKICASIFLWVQARLSNVKVVRHNPKEFRISNN